MNIKSVAKLSGVSEHTLRAWEKRYGLVQPKRSEGGRRLYSTADIEKLQVIAELVSRGHAIGTLAPLKLEELHRLHGQVSRPPTPPAWTSHSGTSPQEVLAALERQNLEEVDRLILSARISSPARIFALNFVSPLLGQMSEHYECGKIDIAQEHALSAILRTHLGELLSLLQKASPSGAGRRPVALRLLFATPEGDLHEFGILLAAILASAHGYRVHYLGPNLPAEDLAKALLSWDANIVVLGAVRTVGRKPGNGIRDYTRRLERGLGKRHAGRISVWIGGCRELPTAEPIQDLRIKTFESLSAYDHELTRVALTG